MNASPCCRTSTAPAWRRSANTARRHWPRGSGRFGKRASTNIVGLRALSPEHWSRRGSQEGIGGICLSDVPRMMAEHDRAHKAEIDAWLADRGGSA